nr:cyclin-D3-1-like [Ipomoea batatas]
MLRILEKSGKQQPIEPGSGSDMEEYDVMEDLSSWKFVNQSDDDDDRCPRTCAGKTRNFSPFSPKNRDPFEAVWWILKVNVHYRFSPLTPILAINYLDRFLSSLQYQEDKLWMIHLAAVACVSLAAKVEETQVPL